MGSQSGNGTQHITDELDFNGNQEASQRRHQRQLRLPGKFKTYAHDGRLLEMSKHILTTSALHGRLQYYSSKSTYEIL